LSAASASCRMLFLHCVRRADSRADWTAGNSRLTKTPMMAMTTNSSISVNPALERGLAGIRRLFVFMRFVLEEKGSVKKGGTENCANVSGRSALEREVEGVSKRRQ
jgi:hypothetical protein